MSYNTEDDIDKCTEKLFEFGQKDRRKYTKSWRK